MNGGTSTRDARDNLRVESAYTAPTATSARASRATTALRSQRKNRLLGIGRYCARGGTVSSVGPDSASEEPSLRRRAAQAQFSRVDSPHAQYFLGSRDRDALRRDARHRSRAVDRRRAGRPRHRGLRARCDHPWGRGGVYRPHDSRGDAVSNGYARGGVTASTECTHSRGAACGGPQRRGGARLCAHGAGEWRRGDGLDAVRLVRQRHVVALWRRCVHSGQERRDLAHCFDGVERGAASGLRNASRRPPATHS